VAAGRGLGKTGGSDWGGATRTKLYATPPPHHPRLYKKIRKGGLNKRLAKNPSAGLTLQRSGGSKETTELEIDRQKVPESRAKESYGFVHEDHFAGQGKGDRPHVQEAAEPPPTPPARESKPREHRRRAQSKWKISGPTEACREKSFLKGKGRRGEKDRTVEPVEP